MIRKNGVILGMSGGVDSSVAAFLLKQQGFDVHGISLLTSPLGQAGLEDAQAISRQLGIHWEMIDVQDIFRDIVIRDFVDAYTHGRTPNPCVLCNPSIKFNVLSQAAERLGCQHIATGHYAQVKTIPDTGRLALAKTEAGLKDQTYFMYRLPQMVLARLIFPLAGMTKPDVRQIAEKAGLLGTYGDPVAAKPDSQDNCFVPGTSYVDYLRQQLEQQDHDALRLFQEGPVVNMSGQHIGTHKGLVHYTLGQRKGFSVQTTERLFVVGRDYATNTLVVGPHEQVMFDRIRVVDPVYSGLSSISSGERLDARIRNSAKEVPCTVYPLDSGSLTVEFDHPVSAPAPGQSCVFYRDGLIMAGGYIAD